MPTPPPLWIETQDAPAAVFTSAFNRGQSATASEPSFILSVSRNGEATEPQSRWSRPITMGALIVPFFTSSLMASPNCARSPYPSLQTQHAFNVLRHGVERTFLISLRIALAQF